MAKKIRATDETLGKLHEAVARDLLAKVMSGEATAQDLNAAIKFLANNGIEGEIKPKDLPGALQTILPSFEDEETE